MCSGRRRFPSPSGKVNGPGRTDHITKSYGEVCAFCRPNRKFVYNRRHLFICFFFPPPDSVAGIAHFWTHYPSVPYESPQPPQKTMAQSDTESNASSPGYYIPRRSAHSPSPWTANAATTGSLSSCDLTYHKSLFSLGDEYCASFFAAAYLSTSPLPLHKAAREIANLPAAPKQRSVTVAVTNSGLSSSSETTQASKTSRRALYLTALRRWTRRDR